MTMNSALDASMLELLQRLLRIPSVSGQEGDLTRFVCDWTMARGWQTDLWQAEIKGLQKFSWPIARHLPLEGRPTLVVRLRGTGGGRSVIFNAHADVVSAGNVSAWKHNPWGGETDGDRVFGRGACDVKGPLVSALWAMTLIEGQRPRGDVLLELIPGEEDCVGLGTLTSVARGWSADGCVVLEPTDNRPCNASRGGVRFEIVVHGRAVHGTVKWLGEDAIRHSTFILNGLNTLESQFNDRAADPDFDVYPFARPITVDTFRGGEWQGMVCDRCLIGGYFELLPNDDASEWKQRFETELRQIIGPAVRIEVSFPETYTGHRTDASIEFCKAAGMSNGLGFNSGCEAGLRFSLLKTPTIVWGPGSLAQAHAADEFIDFSDVRRCAEQMTNFAIRWCGGDTEGLT